MLRVYPMDCLEGLFDLPDDVTQTGDVFFLAGCPTVCLAGII